MNKMVTAYEIFHKTSKAFLTIASLPKIQN